MSKGPVRHIRLRAVLAYPAVALVVAVTLAMSPFGPEQSVARAALPTPTDTSTATAAPTTTGPTAADSTTAGPTSAPTTDSAVATTSATTTATATADALAPTTAATTAPGPVPNPTPGTDPSLAPTPGAPPVGHHVLARIDGSTFQVSYLAVDSPALDASQFQTFRVRFQLHNAGPEPLTASPQLEYRPDGAAGFIVVPDKPKPGIAFQVAREWVPSPGADGGTDQGPLGADIAARDLRMPSEVGVGVVGHRSMGANPDAPMTLPAASFTEEEFTVRLTMGAKYLTGYELRITNGGTALTGTQVARIVLGSPPPVQLSDGQRQGVAVDDTPKTNAAGVAFPLLSAPSRPAGAASAPAVSASSPTRYALASGSLSPATASLATPAASEAGSVHGPYSVTTDMCATCHRGHAAKAPSLLTQPGEQSALCLSCHNGMGAATDVQAEYSLTLPANNPAAREYYSHDPVASTPAAGHTQSELDEFGGQSNRHSGCSDCHNSHKANGADGAETPTGWNLSGRLSGVSGVAVTNGAAGTAPSYTFLNGTTDPVTREYQLCFKCHSGATTLTDNTGLKPSKYALDKGVEFNPENPSFHPVEAAGKNGTDAMKSSLAKSSPYKLWNFNVDSTIRCLNCHASSTTPGPSPEATGTPPAAADGSLPPHASSNRGILLRNYLDRELKPRVDTAAAQTRAAYSAGDFALCYVCHGEEPFLNSSSTATNFPLHALHLTSLAGKGSGGTDIDTAGDGQGNAICAECHFRIHSATEKVGTQVISGSRLVNFAPDVKPVVPTGKVGWTEPGANTTGSCTLTCHGKSHNSFEYND